MITVDRMLSGSEDIAAVEKTGPWSSMPVSDSIYSVLGSAARARADRPAVTYLPTGDPDDDAICLDFRQFFGSVTAAANLFHHLGAGPGEIISLLLPNLPQTQIALWGATAAGIANPLNFLLQVDQLEGLLRAAKTKILVALGPNPMLPIWEKALALHERMPELTILRVGPGEDLPGILCFDAALAEHNRSDLDSGRTFKRTDPAICFHTGGTTGMPKLAVRSHENDLYCAWVTAQFAHFEEDSSMVCALPLFHVGGAIICSLAPLLSGCGIIMPSAVGLRHPNALGRHWRMIEKYRPTHVGAVPTSLAALLDVPVDGADLSSIKHVLTGGALLPLEVERTWKERFDTKISQIYGMTEAGVTIAAAPVYYQAPLGSAGLRLPYGSFKIVENPRDRPFLECPPGHKGSIIFKSPGVFDGYLDPTQSGAVLADDGWLNTGDLGYVDEQGHLFISGRSKDLIIRGAHNIDPALIEEELVAHPAVALAAAVGKPDTYAGELPVAFVTLCPGAETTPEGLSDWVKERIAERPAFPKEIHILDEMPMTAVGKIFKPKLRQMLAEQVFTEALADFARQGAEFVVTAGHSRRQGILVRVTIRNFPEQQRTTLGQEIKHVLDRFLISHVLEWA